MLEFERKNTFDETIKFEKVPIYKAGEKFMGLCVKRRYLIAVNFCLYFSKTLPELKRVYFKAA